MGHQFNGNVARIFDVQEQISAKVAEILSARFTAAEGTLPTLGGTKILRPIFSMPMAATPCSIH